MVLSDIGSSASGDLPNVYYQTSRFEVDSLTPYFMFTADYYQPNTLIRNIQPTQIAKLVVKLLPDTDLLIDQLWVNGAFRRKGIAVRLLANVHSFFDRANDNANDNTAATEICPWANKSIYVLPQLTLGPGPSEQDQDQNHADPLSLTLTTAVICSMFEKAGYSWVNPNCPVFMVRKSTLGLGWFD